MQDLKLHTTNNMPKIHPNLNCLHKIITYLWINPLQPIMPIPRAQCQLTELDSTQRIPNQLGPDTSPSWNHCIHLQHLSIFRYHLTRENKVVMHKTGYRFQNTSLTASQGDTEIAPFQVYLSLSLNSAQLHHLIYATFYWWIGYICDTKLPKLTYK